MCCFVYKLEAERKNAVHIWPPSEILPSESVIPSSELRSSAILTLARVNR